MGLQRFPLSPFLILLRARLKGPDVRMAPLHTSTCKLPADYED
jgi:hypothetical protein